MSNDAGGEVPSTSVGEQGECPAGFWEHHWTQFEGTWPARDIYRAKVICSLVPDGTRSVLEVGCGSGLIINSIPLDETMGVDVSAAALQSVAGPSFQCSLESLPFADRSYDLVVASEVLEHLPAGAYEQSLSETARVANRHIIVSVPNREYLKANMTRCPNCGAEYHRNMHVRSYDSRALEGIFEGFDTVSCTQIGPDEQRRTRLEVLVRRVLRYDLPPPWHTLCPWCKTAHDAPNERRSGDSQQESASRLASRLAPAKRLVKHRMKPWLVALYKRAG